MNVEKIRQTLSQELAARDKAKAAVENLQKTKLQTEADLKEAERTIAKVAKKVLLAMEEGRALSRLDAQGTEAKILRDTLQDRLYKLQHPTPDGRNYAGMIQDAQAKLAHANDQLATAFKNALGESKRAAEAEMTSLFDMADQVFDRYNDEVDSLIAELSITGVWSGTTATAPCPKHTGLYNLVNNGFLVGGESEKPTMTPAAEKEPEDTLAASGDIRNPSGVLTGETSVEHEPPVPATPIEQPFGTPSNGQSPDDGHNVRCK